ncbi:MAG: hypothetical protein FWE66_04775, partial [Oscillospiraceae bacterium]|nr:hypothetical protein [Oscillospiraceae bacterium]
MKKIITLIIVLAAVLSLAVPAFAAPAPVPGAPAWDAAKYASAKVIAPSLGPDKDLPNNPRDNASGDKISSNAHSADFPGIYFYWNDKQKDNGVLLVEEWVFDLFVEGKFTLTAKNSNNYWGYSISPAAAQKIGGVYAFGISKQIKYNEIGNNGKISSKTDDLKNINMVFIDGKYKPGYVEIAKNWFDEEGEAIADRAALDAQLSFNGSYKLGINEIKISNYSEAVNGKKVTIMESAPDGFIERDGKSIQTVTVKHSDDPIKVVTFNNRKQYAKIEIVKVWLDEDGEKITDADILAELEANFEISGAAAFLGINLVKEGAYIVSEVDPLTAGFTLVGDNDIEVDVKAGKKITVTFENKEDPIITRKFGADIEKWVDGQLIAEFYGGLDDEEYAAIFAMMSFKLYKVDAKGGVIEEENFIADGALEFSGIISFGGLELEEEGWYAIVEELTDEGKELFVEADPLYVYVSALGVHDREPYAWVSGVDFGVPVYHSGAGVNYILPDVWDEVLSGQPAYEALKKMGALWVWDAVDTYQYGESGSVYTDEFTFTADEAGTVTGFLAADNAAVVYVNGKLAGYTTVAFNTPGNIPAENLADFNYGAMDASVFDGGWAEGWNHSYAFDINYNEGENTVTIIAANSARTSGTGTANDGYDDTNNPCGLLFGFITPPDAIFENSTIVTRQFGVDIEKWVDGESIVVWALDNGYDDLEALLSFDLYKFDDDADDWVWVA